MALELPPIDINYEANALKARSLKIPVWTEEILTNTTGTRAIFYKPGYFTHHDPNDPQLVRFRHPKEAGGFPFSLKKDFMSMKPGKFLKEFFSDKLSDEEIAKIANTFRADANPPIIEFATTADEMERIYDVGPDSCMKKPGQWAKNKNPVRAYAGHNLALAYLTRRGKPSARALVWPDKKIYGRIYGDAVTLTKLLTEQGFTCAYGNGEDRPKWDGAMLTPIAIDGLVYEGDHKIPVFNLPYGDMWKQCSLVRKSSGEFVLIVDSHNKYRGKKHSMTGTASVSSTTGTPAPLDQLKDVDTLP